MTTDINNVLKTISYPNDTEALDVYYFYKTEQLTFLIILFVVIVYCNIVIIFHMIRYDKTKKSRMNFFILNLAIADFLNGFLNVSVDILSKLLIEWTYGRVMCKCVRYLQATFAYAGTYVLIALTIDRYYAITHPLSVRFNRNIADTSIIIAWSLSMLFGLPSFFLFEESIVQGNETDFQIVSKGKVQCWMNLENYQWKIYITTIAILLFFIPCLIIIYCYTNLTWTVWLKSKCFAVNRKGSDDSTVTLDEEYMRQGLRQISAMGILSKAKIKTVKISVLVTSAFIVCWSPYFVYNLLSVYDFLPNTQELIAVSTFIQSLAPLNSAVNPIIYGAFAIKGYLKYIFPFSIIYYILSLKKRANISVTSISTLSTIKKNPLLAQTDIV